MALEELSPTYPILSTNRVQKDSPCYFAGAANSSCSNAMFRGTSHAPYAAWVLDDAAGDAAGARRAMGRALPGPGALDKSWHTQPPTGLDKFRRLSMLQASRVE